MSEDKPTKKKSQPYVNNKAFYEAIKKYREDCRTALAEEKPKPRIPEYIGECIYKIATNLMRNYKFHGKYAFEDEMISDACIQCIKYLNTFDPEKSNNPFSFFTTCCYNSFITRVKEEKKQMYVRTKMIIELPAMGELADVDTDDHSMDNIEVAYENMHSFVDEYEKKNGLGRPRKKRASKLSLVDETALDENKPLTIECLFESPIEGVDDV